MLSHIKSSQTEQTWDNIFSSVAFLLMSYCRLGQVLRHNGIRAPGFSGPQARNVDLEDKFESMIDANDQLAESIVSNTRMVDWLIVHAFISKTIFDSNLSSSRYPEQKTVVILSRLNYFGDIQNFRITILHINVHMQVLIWPISFKTWTSLPHPLNCHSSL